MKIKNITFEKIGVFEKIHLDFQQFKKKENKAEIHILTGANGTGKTTLLQAIARFFHPNDANYFDKKLKKDSSNIQMELDNHEILRFNRSEYQPTSAIQQYNQISTSNEKPTGPIEFAVFAYSGYRFLNRHPVHALAKYGNGLFSKCRIEATF